MCRESCSERSKSTTVISWLHNGQSFTDFRCWDEVCEVRKKCVLLSLSSYSRISFFQKIFGILFVTLLHLYFNYNLILDWIWARENISILGTLNIYFSNHMSCGFDIMQMDCDVCAIAISFMQIWVIMIRLSCIYCTKNNTERDEH